MRRACFVLLALSVAEAGYAQATYDILLKGGHVIDGRNSIDAVRDVGIKDGKIAAVQANIPATQATKTVDVSGLYVTPGLIDIHVHVYTGEGESYSRGFRSVPPDGFTLESCTTAVADAGSSGWRNFEDFKTRIIDKSRTRVFAFLNIVGNGMGGGQIENNLKDMEGKVTGEFALKYKGVVVGVKSAHYGGTGVGPLHPGRRGGEDRRHPGHGRLRQRQRSHDQGALREVFPSGGHLYARLRRRRPQGDSRRQGQSRDFRGAEEGDHLRHRPRRRQFRVVHRGAGVQGEVPIPTPSRPTCTSAA